jgi:hypothetical protein
MGLVTIKISEEAWLSYKQVMSDDEWGRTEECQAFHALVDAIGLGNDELLELWREKMRDKRL